MFVWVVLSLMGNGLLAAYNLISWDLVWNKTCLDFALNFWFSDFFYNKTKYFRLRLTDEVSSERSKRDLKETWDWPGTDLRLTWDVRLTWDWLVLTWDWPGTDLGLTWNWPGTDLRLTWDAPETDLGCTWDWPKTDLRLTWDWRRHNLRLT